MSRKLQDFYLTVDLRSLGFYRILLALLLIIDWFLRWPDLEAFYSSFGVVPIEAPLPKPGGVFHFCLLDGATSLVMVRLVFCLGLACYLLFLVGYRTRIFQALSLVFFLSVLSRVTLIRDGSVMVLSTMLVWSLFLPLGKRFSVDALIERVLNGVSGPDRSPRVLAETRSAPSLAAFAIVAQIGLIYFFTATAKHGATWKDGTALYYALNLDQVDRPLGRWLALQPLPLLKMLTWGVLGLEFAALPLILTPVWQPWLRRFAIAALVAMHLGIALTTTLGFFSATMVSTYALLLLPQDWDFLENEPGLRRAASATRAALARLRQPGSRVGQWIWLIAPETAKRMHGSTPPTSAHERLRISAYKAWHWVVNCLVAVIFVTFTLDAYNLNTAQAFGQEPVAQPGWMRAIIRTPLMQQDWELFAPDPNKEDGWWVIVGETESGEQVDPLTGKTPTFDKPADPASQFDRFWRKYLDRIRLKKNSEYRLYFGKYITRKNHREMPPGRRLTRFAFYYVKEVTQPPGTPGPWPTERQVLWHHDCFPPASQSKVELP